MIDDAEAKGILKAGSTIIEPTSGNTKMEILGNGRGCPRLPDHYRYA